MRRRLLAMTGVLVMACGTPTSGGPPPGDSGDVPRQGGILRTAQESEPGGYDVQKVTDVTKKGDDLILKFAGNFQGNAFDAMITLTPDGTDKVKVTFDINGGQFTMSGTGVKK